jgi:hypothetical protein
MSTDALLTEALAPHEGIFITGPEQIEHRIDSLPEPDDQSVLLQSLINCRCSSDEKAIKQFDRHARVPTGAAMVAMGHETVQRVIQAPPATGLKPGDLVLITPGHSAEPVDPETFVPAQDGVLAALGYSYKNLGGLRRFNRVPALAIETVPAHGFGQLFSKVPGGSRASLASLAHAEPYACNAGTNKHIFTFSENNPEGAFVYDVPPRAIVSYLGGTARMAMINLTIVANMPIATLPRVVQITGSQRKLDELAEFALIQELQAKGVTIELIDRNAEDIEARLLQHGKSDVVWTNFPAQEVYDQAVAIIAPGGNINSYAGAANPDIGFHLKLAAWQSEQPDEILNYLHHNLQANDPQRYRGVKVGGVVALVNFPDALAQGLLRALPRGHRVHYDGELPEHVERAATDAAIDDVIVWSQNADHLSSAYAEITPRLARGAAVALLGSGGTVFVPSRDIHYRTRHSFCGPNVPFYFTNTSEPVASDMQHQADEPIDFDWLVRGVCGLRAVPELMMMVRAKEPFGTYLALLDLPELPSLAVEAAAFAQAAADTTNEALHKALSAAAAVLEDNGNRWSRAVEDALYAGYGLDHPLTTN